MEKLELIFSQHGEHRKLLTRVLTLLNYWFTGNVNLSALIVIGNLFLLGIGGMFFAFIKQKKDAGILVFLIILLIFNGQNFETSTWAMGGLQDMAILLMAMLSIYCIMQTTNLGFTAGLIFSVITIFSHGNGMCLLPSVLLSFILQKSQRKKGKMIWFTIVTSIAIGFYFFDWEMPNKSGISELLHRIPSIMTGFFRFLGANLWLPSVKIVAFLWGLFIFGTYVLALIGKFYKKNIIWFTFFTFMLLTAAMVSLNRPADEIVPMRYRIHCCMGTVLTIMFYYENREALHLTRWFKFLVPPILLFSVFCSMLYFEKCEKFSEYKKVTTYNWQRDKSGLCPNTKNMDTILQRAENMHIYTMPKLPLKNLAADVEVVGGRWQNHNSRISYNIDYVEETSEYVLIKGWAYTDEMSMDFTDISLCLFNENQNIKVRPYAERRYELPFSLTIKENCGFFAVIPKAMLPQDDYNVGIEIQKRYIVPVKKSTKSIDTDIQVQI
jgi:hypothetical protein